MASGTESHMLRPGCNQFLSLLHSQQSLGLLHPAEEQAACSQASGTGVAVEDLNVKTVPVSQASSIGVAVDACEDCPCDSGGAPSPKSANRRPT